MDIHFQVRHAERCALLYGVTHRLYGVTLLLSVVLLQVLAEFDICIQRVVIRRDRLIGVCHVQRNLQFGLLGEQTSCLQRSADLNLVVVVHVPLQHIALDASVACCLQSSCHVELRYIADAQCRVGHCCYAALLVELAHPEFVHPDLGTTFLMAVGVTHTDHDTLHALQRRITQHGYTVLRLTARLIVHHVGDSVTHVGCAGTFGFVTSHLGIGQYREREIEHVLRRPNLVTVLLAVVVVIACGREYQRNLVLVVVVLQVSTQADEARQVTILQVGIFSLQFLGVNKHLQMLVVTHVVGCVFVHGTCVAEWQVVHTQNHRLFVLCNQLRLPGVGLTADARRQDIVDRRTVAVLLDIYVLHIHQGRTRR